MYKTPVLSLPGKRAERVWSASYHRVVSAECCVTQQHIFTRNLINLTAHVRACSVLASGATLYTRFARLLGNGSRIWLAVGLRTAVRCAPQARAKAVSGKKSQPSDAD